ncbi:MAG: hypothetical protein VSS75_032810, partial [Candidatus Parabeggiatoa sp.]|nr:hypothetical protein [Candidatus Parabeggiatoa sp.]
MKYLTLLLLFMSQTALAQELFDYEYCPSQDLGPSASFMEWCNDQAQESDDRLTRAGAGEKTFADGLGLIRATVRFRIRDAFTKDDLQNVQAILCPIEDFALDYEQCERAVSGQDGYAYFYLIPTGYYIARIGNNDKNIVWYNKKPTYTTATLIEVSEKHITHTIYYTHIRFQFDKDPDTLVYLKVKRPYEFPVSCNPICPEKVLAYVGWHKLSSKEVSWNIINDNLGMLTITPSGSIPKGRMNILDVKTGLRGGTSVPVIALKNPKFFNIANRKITIEGCESDTHFKWEWGENGGE